MNNVHDTLLNFFSKYPQANYNKGDRLYFPGDNIDKAYFIKSGYVREYSISKEGVELTLHLYKPNSFFPMTGIIADINNRYFYEVFTDSILVKVPKNEILEFLNSNQTALFDLTSRLLQGLDKMLLRVEGFAYKSSYERVISALLFLNRHFGKEIEGKISFNQKFTHNEIAAFAGVTRETVTRELKKLKDMNLINMEENIYLNLEALVKESR